MRGMGLDSPSQPGYDDTRMSAEAITYLRHTAGAFGPDVLTLTDRVLDYPGFTTWSGSIKDRHHYGAGGLLQHTYEVTRLCMANWETLTELASRHKVCRRTLFLGAVFHDLGKVHDYEVRDPYTPGMGNAFDSREWIATPHHRRIHHINRSAVVWARAVSETNLCRDIEDDVLHAILAHHGSPERGSPVLPQTREAWMLHLADAMSAWHDGVGKMDPKP